VRWRDESEYESGEIKQILLMETVTELEEMLAQANRRVMHLEVENAELKQQLVRTADEIKAYRKKLADANEEEEVADEQQQQRVPQEAHDQGRSIWGYVTGETIGNNANGNGNNE